VASRAAYLAACLGRGQAELAALRSERLLSFFLGSSLALCLAIIVLVSLPEEQPETFSSAYFLSSFAPFRLVWSMLLSFWCAGAAARACEDNCINHMFILEVDPRCSVSARFLFGKASVLTTLWILLFGMYIVDYKWMLLPTTEQHRLHTYRSSWHFVLYPSVLLCLAIATVLWPSRVCGLRYKGQLLRAIGRTCLAPFYAVSFGDNLVGDVMTSLAKPIQDIPASVCYLASHHPQLPGSVDLLIHQGDTCPPLVHACLLPLIAALPFVFRLLQCARRFRDTRESKHLWNFGKYVCSVLVVAVGSMWRPQAGCVVAASVVATVYAATWDVLMDWGVELPGARPCGPAALEGASTLVAEADAGHEGGRRHFGAKAYLLASVLNVAMRMTWVLTLMPISLIAETNMPLGAALHVGVSTIEILRRCIWAVLRIENEQATNASHYRAFLWVPMRIKAATSSSLGCSRVAGALVA